MIPGFESYLRREHPEEFVEEKIVNEEPVRIPSVSIMGAELLNPMQIHNRDRKTEINSSDGITVVEVANSSSIAKLEYDSNTKMLTTTYVSGGKYTHANVEPETFDRIAKPGIEFQCSIGKAHHFLIVKGRR